MRTRPGTRHWIISMTGASLVCLLALGGAFGRQALGRKIDHGVQRLLSPLKERTPAAQTGSIPPQSEGGPEYLLLLGLDKRGKLPGRTDAIALLALEPVGGHLGVISVPRDLWVEIPGHGPGRINKVYRVGRRNGGSGGGERLIRQVLGQELGIEPDLIVVADFAGFEKTVDLLGGIPVEVACPIEDNFIAPQRKSGYERLELKKGRQLLSGRTALLFAVPATGAQTWTGLAVSRRCWSGSSAA